MMKYIDFKEIIKTYSKDVKKNQVSRKKSKLELALITFLFVFDILSVVLIILGMNICATISYIILFTIAFVLMSLIKRNDRKNFGIIMNNRNKNYNIKIKCLKKCFKTYDIDINTPQMLKLAFDEYSYYLSNNPGITHKINEIFLALLFPSAIAIIGSIFSNAYEFSIMTIVISLVTLYVIKLNSFAINGLVRREYCREEIHNILFNLNVSYANKNIQK